MQFCHIQWNINNCTKFVSIQISNSKWYNNWRGCSLLTPRFRAHASGVGGSGTPTWHDQRAITDNRQWHGTPQCLAFDVMAKKKAKDDARYGNCDTFLADMLFSSPISSSDHCLFWTCREEMLRSLCHIYIPPFLKLVKWIPLNSSMLNGSILLTQQFKNLLDP